MKDSEKVGLVCAGIFGLLIILMSIFMAFDFSRTPEEFWEIFFTANAILWSVTLIVAAIILKMFGK